jgi:teichuronic acid biosynthesis glycosyltransferase TuaC
MKVLIFSLAYFPHVGGAEVAIKEITERLSETKFHLITLRFNQEPTEEMIGNVRVYRVGNGASYLQKILFIPRAARRAAALHREHGFNAIWAMMTYMLFPTVLLRAHGVRIPYVLNLQDGDPFTRVFNRWFILPLKPLLTYGIRHAASIVALSSYLTTWTARFGYAGQVKIVPNGVDLTRFVQTHTHARSLEDLVLVTTSRLVHKNALDDVIRALVLLPSSVRFRIYGTGREERALRALAKELRVEEQVEFKGFVEHAALPSVLNEADIFVRPSRSEGMGISFVEAMAAGLPVIATQEGGIADFLFDARRDPDKPATGWAVPVDSPEEIANAVKDVATNPAKTAIIVENAKQLVAERYSWDPIAQEWHEVFQRAAQTRTMAV